MNRRGQRQVDQLKKQLDLLGVLKGVSYGVASPLQRSTHTLKILTDSMDCVTDVDESLLELNYGAWQGTSRNSWPEDAQDQWIESPWSLRFPRGECLADVQRRAMHAIHKIAEAHVGETVIVSAHGHVNRVILHKALGVEQSEFWAIRQRNAEAWRMDVQLCSDGALQFHNVKRLEAPVTHTIAQDAIDNKTKPVGSLGVLEHTAVKLAVLQQTLSPRIEAARICTFGADHGVALEGVSAYPREVTAKMMHNFAKQGAAINVLSTANGIDVEVIDVGVDADLLSVDGIRHEKIRMGSRNFLHEPALLENDLKAALAVGERAVRRAVRAGMDVIGLGEMGIGNTTSASALLTALTGYSAQFTVGEGTGVRGDALEHKRSVVEQAVRLHGSCVPQGGVVITASESLRCYGGLEIAAMAGAALEATKHTIVVMADGFISTVAVFAAAMMMKERGEPLTPLTNRLFLAHRSAESGYQVALNALSQLTGVPQRPLLDLSMRLGEGTGAALAVPLLKSAAAIMCDMATFSELV